MESENGHHRYYCCQHPLLPEITRLVGSFYSAHLLLLRLDNKVVDDTWWSKRSHSCYCCCYYYYVQQNSFLNLQQIHDTDIDDFAVSAAAAVVVVVVVVADAVATAGYEN